MRGKPIILLLIVMTGMLVVPTSASSVAITIKKQQAIAQASFALTLNQNVTQLPNQTSSMNLASDNQLAQAFTEALKRANSSASPTDLTVNIASKPNLLSIDTSMTLSGVTQRRGDILTVDLGWKALNVSADLRAGNLSYNTIGKRYFRPIVEFYSNASRFVGKPNATITGVSFLVNATSVGPKTAEDYAGNFTIFDFTGLSSPLEKWDRVYSLANDTTTWYFAPPQRLTFLITVQRHNRTAEYFATYGYDAGITVAGLARAHGNSVVVDVGTGTSEWIMTGVVVLSIVVAIVAQLLFRARKKKYSKMGRW